MARRATSRGDNILFTSTGMATNGSYSYCAWVRADHDAAANAGIYEDTLCFGAGGGSYVVFAWDHESADYAGAVIHEGNDQTWRKVSLKPLYADHLYHIAAVYDASAQTLAGYRNGRRMGVETSVPASSAAAGLCRIFGDGATNALNVVAAESAFWSRVLTSEEIELLAGYRRPSDFPTGLVFYAPLLGSASPEPDLGPSEWSGVLTGTAQYTHPVLDVPSPGASTPSLLRVHPTNGRLFCDREGRGLVLGGSHQWYTFQDNWNDEPIDFPTYLANLATWGHNVVRLWCVEPYVSGQAVPSRYQRTGPGDALDGGPKYDLSKFNQSFFDRLRARCVDAGNAGKYVCICLWNSWSLRDHGEGNPWPNHALNASNNINSINGDWYDSDGEGSETHEVRSGSMNDALLALHKAFITKVVETIGDLENVFFEISNEDDLASENTAWQEAMLAHLRAQEITLGTNRHLVGLTMPLPFGAPALAMLAASSGEWTGPGGSDYESTVPANDGSKIQVVDTDHVWGIGGDATWAWKTFVRGLHPLVMDDFVTSQDGLRYAVGDLIALSKRLALGNCVPNGALCSTGYCLAWPGQQYVALQPGSGAFTINFATAGRYRYEWRDIATRSVYSSGLVSVASGDVQFTPPTADCRILFLTTADQPGLLVW